MTIGERLNLAARGDIFTIITPWARITNTRDFFLSCFEEAFFSLKIVRQTQTEDGRNIIVTEGAE